jgi:hypothetical protein
MRDKTAHGVFASFDEFRRVAALLRSPEILDDHRDIETNGTMVGYAEQTGADFNFARNSGFCLVQCWNLIPSARVGLWACIATEKTLQPMQYYF